MSRHFDKLVEAHQAVERNRHTRNHFTAAILGEVALGTTLGLLTGETGLGVSLTALMVIPTGIVSVDAFANLTNARHNLRDLIETSGSGEQVRQLELTPSDETAIPTDLH